MNNTPPPKIRGDRIKRLHESLNIIDIEATQNLKVDGIIFIKLRSVYRNHLKRYRLARWIFRWLWCNGYSFYLKYLTKHLSKSAVRRWCSLISLGDFSKKNGIATYKITDAEHIVTPVPAIFPIADQSYLELPHDQYDYPEVSVAVVDNAVIYGGSNLVFVDDDVICHDLFDEVRDSTNEEHNGWALINAKSKRVRWLLNDKKPFELPTAATFVDACAQNYAHWLTEVLPRIALFCNEECYKDVPIVVNNGLHPNILDSLLMVTGSERKIFTLPTSRAMAVNKLYITSVAGYVPFGRRTSKGSGHSHGIFSLQAFETLCFYFDDQSSGIDEHNWPEKIYIRRNSGMRKVVNIDEIEELLVERGFVFVEPEKLTFLQQVKLFKNAKIIVGATGAGLSNAIFCMPGTHVAVFMGKHEDMIYRYWLNMLAPLKLTISYVLGEIVKNKDLGIHGDFVVSSLEIINLLESMEKE